MLNCIFSNMIHVAYSSFLFSVLKIPVLNVQVKLVPAFCTVAGTVFSSVNYFQVIFTGGVGKNGSTIAVAHMTKSEMHLQDTAFIGPALLFFNQYFNSFIDEYIVLWIALVFSLFDLIRYSISVCNQIASHLHIEVFRIKTHATHSNRHYVS
ncbi:hypothetical protein GDO78_008441 [Eleutherodactylus coqui]|uniref:Uncharacterized protein n=1 Tax=Eleutherodactylus coqui TaxID=57060 RepID=A0A8J6FD13_ELECQ|nr:hypothetical protein GDO78_008441 [Eleutherodactylus coqui]